ncbi:MAG: hypothetical protein OEV80_10035, partial [candidate division Zixibacteria bacterium]|nr:hypothetical protein [candidate division Zixibacteria bacterium]
MRMVFLTIVVLCSALAAQAVLPPMLSVAPHFRTLDGLSYQFQGTGNNGQPIPDGPHLFGFSIWNDTGSSGAMLWSESQTVETEGGLGSVMLGASVPIPLDVFGVGGGDTTKALYLDITLDSESISPRTRLLPAPFARVAERLLGDVVTGPA